MIRRRRWLLAVGGAVACAGCTPFATPAAAVPAAPSPARAWQSAAELESAPGERIIDVATGAVLRPSQVLSRIEAADVALLGEQHDNHHHHARRAQLLRALRPGAPVVFEQLPRGASVAPDAGAADPDRIGRRLQAAGVDLRAWRWPLHAPLVQAVWARGDALIGGNLPRSEVLRTMREGPSALPSGLREVLERSPLAPSARAALERDLLHSHCGHLDATRMPAMLLAQRARDAAMAQALTESLMPGRCGPSDARAAACSTTARPAVLIAGNGHVRRDYGVPQILRVTNPTARVLAVGWGEQGGALDDADEATPFDIVWITPRVEREDPCAAMGAGPR